MLRQILIISLISISAASAAHAAGNAKAGQTKAALCMGCHGDKGWSVANNYPNLASQHANYIEKQITEFKSGARKDATMSGMAATLPDGDIADVAAFFSSQPRAAAEGAAGVRPDILTRGKQLYKGGDRYKEIPACMACHGPNGSGNPQARYPLLAGQHGEYVTNQLKKFKSGERANDPNKIMRDIASRMSQADITAVAAYITTLP